jgi:hypothetical protein
MDKESVMKFAPRPMDEDAGAVGLADATRASTMMAIAQRRYGQPDVLEYTAVDKPVVGDDDVLVRAHLPGRILGFAARFAAERRKTVGSEGQRSTRDCRF